MILSAVPWVPLISTTSAPSASVPPAVSFFPRPLDSPSPFPALNKVCPSVPVNAPWPGPAPFHTHLTESVYLSIRPHRPPHY